jgi:hypothetical protein
MIQLYNIIIEFGIPMKLIRLIKMRLNETFSRVQVGKHLSDMFPIKKSLNLRGSLLLLLCNFAVVCAIKRVR